MDRKAITVSLSLIAITIIFVLAESEVVISITTAVILALITKGFINMYKDVKKNYGSRQGRY
jgi:hypothetical protein